MVEQCPCAGLVWGQELYADATKVQAHAAVGSRTPRLAVEAHLENLFWEESLPDGKRKREKEEADSASLTRSVPAATARPWGHEQAAVAKADVASVPRPLPTTLEAMVREEVTKANSERHDWIERAGEPNRAIKRGHEQRRADFLVRTPDPDATLMQRKGGSHFGSQTHSVVDGGNARILLAAVVTPSDVLEHQPLLDLLWRVRFRWKLHPRQFTGDPTSGAAENLVAWEEPLLRASVPWSDCEQRADGFGQRDFRCVAPREVSLGPNEAEWPLFLAGWTEQDWQYRARASVCKACPLKAPGTTSNTGRRRSRPVAQAYVERVRHSHTPEPYQKARRKRSVWVEPLFGEGKPWHGMRRFRFRRRWRVNGEALVMASGHHLKRFLPKRGWGRRPFPPEAVAAVSPPGRESEAPRHDLLHRPSAAVASLVACWAAKTCVESQMRCFSLTTALFVNVSPYPDDQSDDRIASFLPLFVSSQSQNIARPSSSPVS